MVRSIRTTGTAGTTRGDAERMRAHALSRERRGAVVDYLSHDIANNLLLLDMVEPPAAARNEAAAQVVVAELGNEICGVASLRPSIALSASLDAAAIDTLLPYLGALEVGLVKSPVRPVDLLWERLRSLGRRAVVDRIEVACSLARAELAAEPSLEAGTRVRPAEPGDLEALVIAARASLREEGRPDPFDGDPSGFRRWVRGRLPRARVVEADGIVVFVGYADVQRSEGWLIQGVYTWPEHRRRGYAVAGMLDLAREAFEGGASHVQLAVVDGNMPALRLYEGLGFQPFAELRTILFS